MCWIEIFLLWIAFDLFSNPTGFPRFLTGFQHFLSIVWVPGFCSILGHCFGFTSCFIGSLAYAKLWNISGKNSFFMLLN